jgi:hypothetical protein
VDWRLWLNVIAGRIIQANELLEIKKHKISDPIGLQFDNLIYNKHGEVERVSYNIFNAWRHPNMGGDYGYYGIPLTEKWLSDLGVETINMIWLDNDWSIDLTFEFTQDQNTNDIPEVWVYYNGALLVRLKYVHQLQNFIHSIRNTELTIK